MKYFHSFDFKFQWRFYWNCAISTKFWQSPVCFPLTCLAKCCGLQGGLQFLASTSPGSGQGPPRSHPAQTEQCFGWGSRARSGSQIFPLWSSAVVLEWQDWQYFHGILCCLVPFWGGGRHGFSSLNHHFLKTLKILFWIWEIKAVFLRVWDIWSWKGSQVASSSTPGLENVRLVFEANNICSSCSFLTFN